MLIMSRLGRESRIGFIGAGMVGKSLALAMSRKGYDVVAVASRTFASAEALAGLVSGCVPYRSADDAAQACDVIFITSTDDAIGQIASTVDWGTGQGVVHCSGVASLDVLEPARSRGALPGAIHPLQTFSSVDDAVKTLPGATFAIEGDGEMRSFLEELALELDGVPVFLRPEDKPLYHASVVMMGGLLTGLAGAVAEMWGHFGIDRDRALKSLVPMIRGNATTLDSVGIPAAVAGPYVRGDLGTIRKHLAAFGGQAPEMLPAYCQMALAALPYALEKGNVPQETAAEIRLLLKQALNAAEDRPRQNPQSAPSSDS